MQLWYCQIFSLEEFLTEKFDLKVRLYPQFGYSNETVLELNEICIEAIACQDIPQQMQQELSRLIKEALNSPHVESTFFHSCESEIENTAVWEAFEKLCNEKTKVVEKPSKTTINISENELTENLQTGEYFGVDGSGSNLDKAAIEKIRLKSILLSGKFVYLQSATQGVLSDIRATLKLDGDFSEGKIKRERAIPFRVKARYGCSFLRFTHPREKAITVSIDNEPVTFVYVQKSNQVQSKPYNENEIYTVQVPYTEIRNLFNVEVRVDESWKMVRYRPAGYSDLIEKTTDANERAKLELKYDNVWRDLPVGVDVGYNFVPSAKYSVRATGLESVKDFDFNPISNRTFIFGRILESKIRPEPQKNY
jgi:hypothetical protein